MHPLHQPSPAAGGAARRGGGVRGGHGAGHAAWPARLARTLLGVVGGAALALLSASVVIVLYPDARALNRLYAGIFIAPLVWLLLLFDSALAATPWRAAGRQLAAAVLLLALAGLRGVGAG